MKVCRVCLSKDGRLYPISSNGLLLLYNQLTGIFKIEEMEERLPQWVCAECGLRLRSYDKLRQKSLRAYQLLCNLLDKVTYITKENLDQIDRVKNNLQHNLSYKIIDNSNIQTYVYIQEKNECDLVATEKINELTINLEVEETAIELKEVKDIESLLDSEKSVDSHTVIFETVVNDSEKRFESYKHHSDASFSDLDDDSSNSLLSLNIIKQKANDKKEYLNKNKLVNKNKSLPAKIGNKRVAKNTNCHRGKIKIKSKSLNKKNKSESLKNNKGINESAIKIKNSTKSIKKDTKSMDLVDGLITVRRLLSMDEKIAEMEKRRCSTNYNAAPFKCSDCFKGFVSEVTFTRHRIRHSDKCGKVECAICKLRFPNKTSSQRHLVVHSAIYSCSQCKFVSTQRSAALRHGLKHKGKSYQCPHCDRHFVNESSFFGHVRIKHVSHFACELCGYSFSSARGVDIHKNLRHALERDTIVPADGTTCSTCNFKFASDEALKTHQRVSHSDTTGTNKRNEYVYPPAPNRMSIVCELCGVESKNGIAYRAHYRLHHPACSPPDTRTARGIPSAPAMCELCGVLFKSRHNLLVHSKVHSRPRAHKCTECDAGFSSSGNLRGHVLRVHRPGEPQAIYPCRVCGKKLTSSSNLARHTFLHTGLRPFSCQTCGKTFKSKGDLQSHTAYVHHKKPRVRHSRPI